ncbi:MAG: DoxX family protein [Segniliparus sp.]|uniref:DoxX family protein n=1 Tax=Segniliparus sp. TaxID=2804064 RepID=UPI003F32B55F
MSDKVRDIGLLLGRLGFAAALIPHGWQKVHDYGFSNVVASFDQMGVPLPGVSAAVAIAAELVAPVLLALGLLTPVAGLVAVIGFVGALLTAPGHVFNGPHFSGGLTNLFDPGPATAWAGAPAFLFLLVALLITVTGPGRLSLDAIVFKRSEWFAKKD